MTKMTQFTRVIHGHSRTRLSFGCVSTCCKLIFKLLTHQTGHSCGQLWPAVDQLQWIWPGRIERKSGSFKLVGFSLWGAQRRGQDLLRKNHCVMQLPWNTWPHGSLSACSPGKRSAKQMGQVTSVTSVTSTAPISSGLGPASISAWRLGGGSLMHMHSTTRLSIDKCRICPNKTIWRWSSAASALMSVCQKAAACNSAKQQRHTRVQQPLIGKLVESGATGISIVQIAQQRKIRKTLSGHARSWKPIRKMVVICESPVHNR